MRDPDRERRDRERRDELERQLGNLGSSIEYPPTPDLVRATQSRLEEARVEQPPRRSRFRLPSVRWVVAAMLVVVVAVPILSPAGRDTISGLFVGIHSAGSGGSAASSGANAGGIESGTTGGTVRSLGEKLGLGERLTLREARNRAGRDGALLLPHSERLGKPDEFYAYKIVVKGTSKKGFIVAYRPGPKLPALGSARVGLLLTEFPGEVLPAFLRGEDAARSRKVSIGGRKGYWFADGRRLDRQVGNTGRLPGGALIWEQEGRTLLMRVDLPQKQAIRLAESVR